MKRYLNTASELFERSTRARDCHAKLDTLFEANGYVSRAYENYNANNLHVSSRTLQSLDALNKRIRHAVREFADTSCPRTGRR
jgi:hypothetical protein